jgi:hypothetical protein
MYLLALTLTTLTAGLPLFIKWLHRREYASVRVNRGLQVYLRRANLQGPELS